MFKFVTKFPNMREIGNIEKKAKFSLFRIIFIKGHKNY